MTGEHGAARDKDGGKVYAQRAQEHARNDLVAVGDANGGIESVALDSDFKAVCDGLARDQAVVHAVVVHGDAVAYADGTPPAI